jgi:hypothetical protein
MDLKALLQSVQTNKAVEMSLYTGIPRLQFERSGWHGLFLMCPPS